MTERFYSIANIYEKGLGVKKDIKKALKIIRFAGQKGYLEGFNTLGWYYHQRDFCSKRL